MAALIERHGGRATVVPSMREIPLAENQHAIDFAQDLIAGRIDIVLFMTGVGTELLFEIVERHADPAAFLAALEKCRIAVRSPKPATVLNKRRVRIDWKTPEPNTWRQMLAILEQHDLNGKTIAIQEYGKPNEEFREEMEKLGATVIGVPIYRWDLPEDVSALETAINQMIAGDFDVSLFTSAQQAENVLEVADQIRKRKPFLAALHSRIVASIGPTCSEALRAHGLPPDIEASPPKMGNLVRRVLQDGSAILENKENHAC